MSEITRGVIGMPYEMAMGSELSRRQFHAVARELFAENERLKDQVRLAGISAEATVHDAIGRAANDYLLVTLERDQLKAENEALRKAGFADAFYKVAEAVGVIGARAQSPLEVFESEILPALKSAVVDAERWRFVRNPTATGSPFAVWSERTNLFLGKFADEAIDAAMGKGEQS